MQCLSEIGVDGKDIKIIRNLYWNQRASVRIINELSDEIRMQRVVRQGCVASPTLFNLYTEYIFRHINVSTWEAQITTILDMLMTLQNHGNGCQQETKFTQKNIAIDGQQIEQVTSYMYLGSLITENGRSEKKIKRRILIARSIFNNVRTLLSCLSRYKPEDQITSNKMLYLVDTSLWSRGKDNYKIPVVQT